LYCSPVFASHGEHDGGGGCGFETVVCRKCGTELASADELIFMGGGSLLTADGGHVQLDFDEMADRSEGMKGMRCAGTKIDLDKEYDASGRIAHFNRLMKEINGRTYRPPAHVQREIMRDIVGQRLENNISLDVPITEMEVRETIGVLKMTKYYEVSGSIAEHMIRTGKITPDALFCANRDDEDKHADDEDSDNLECTDNSVLSAYELEFIQWMFRGIHVQFEHLKRTNQIECRYGSKPNFPQMSVFFFVQFVRLKRFDLIPRLKLPKSKTTFAFSIGVFNVLETAFEKECELIEKRTKDYCLVPLGVSNTKTELQGESLIVTREDQNRRDKFTRTLRTVPLGRIDLVEVTGSYKNDSPTSTSPPPPRGVFEKLGGI
jgi:hypothetical protein